MPWDKKTKWPCAPRKSLNTVCISIYASAVANHISDGIGLIPFEGDEDPDLINAEKQTITELPNTGYFDSARSFGMIRGEKIAMAILDAVDLVAGVGAAVVIVDHNNKNAPLSSSKSAHCR